MQALLSTRGRQVVALLAVDGLFFGLTDPARAPSAFFIIAFILLAATVYTGLSAFCSLMDWYGLHLKNRYRLGVTVTIGLCALTALQSIGQLSGRDLAVFLPLGALAYFYLSRNQRRYE